MRAGPMRTYGTIEKPVTTDDGLSSSGSVIWTAVRSVWADVQPLRGNERIEGMKMTHTITHRIRMRYRPDVMADMRFNAQGRKLYFESVAPATRKTDIEIMAREETR